MKHVIWTTPTAILIAVAILATLFGGWQISNYVDARNMEDTQMEFARVEKEMRAETEASKERMRQLDLDSFEIKHGLKARLELNAEEMRQPHGKGYAPECEEAGPVDETPEAMDARFTRESKCRMYRLEREYTEIRRKTGNKF